MIGAGMMSIGAGLMVPPIITGGGGGGSAPSVVNKYKNGINTAVHLNSNTTVDATGASMILVMAILNTDASNVPNFVCTFNGISLTRIGYNTPDKINAIFWYMTSPPQGSYTLNVGGSFLYCNSAAIFIYTISGSNASPIDASNFAIATSNPTATITTTVANTLCFTSFGDYYNSATPLTSTPTSPWVLDDSYNIGLAAGQGFCYKTTQTSAGTLSASAQTTYNALAMGLVAIKP